MFKVVYEDSVKNYIKREGIPGEILGVMLKLETYLNSQAFDSLIKQTLKDMGINQIEFKRPIRVQKTFGGTVKGGDSFLYRMQYIYREHCYEFVVCKLSDHEKYGLTHYIAITDDYTSKKIRKQFKEELQESLKREVGWLKDIQYEEQRTDKVVSNIYKQLIVYPNYSEEVRQFIRKQSSHEIVQLIELVVKYCHGPLEINEDLKRMCRYINEIEKI